MEALRDGKRKDQLQEKWHGWVIWFKGPSSNIGLVEGRNDAEPIPFGDPLAQSHVQSGAPQL